ncbi:hypothetical protein [Azotobacter salinestris]|uniref:hypothetical protein n=1 Tax=Azotobacter salinestris TaxID=69964 RepID=UPI0012669259|nr:hypothetical protein [Azotobacter salinestris]
MGQGVNFDNNRGDIYINNERGIARSTVLGKLVEIIAAADSERLDLSRDPADVEVKIKFNDLCMYRWLVDEYIENCFLIDESIVELNRVINSGSRKLKQQVKLFYRQALTKYEISTKPFDLDGLKRNSDRVVKEVVALATELVKSSSDLQQGYYDEDINFGIHLIISYAIIECIVLENPNDHD